MAIRLNGTARSFMSDHLSSFAIITTRLAVRPARIAIGFASSPANGELCPLVRPRLCSPVTSFRADEEPPRGLGRLSQDPESGSLRPDLVQSRAIRKAWRWATERGRCLAAEGWHWELASSGTTMPTRATETQESSSLSEIDDSSCPTTAWRIS
jgi:hypothetical protein